MYGIYVVYLFILLIYFIIIFCASGAQSSNKVEYIDMNIHLQRRYCTCSCLHAGDQIDEDPKQKLKAYGRLLDDLTGNLYITC